MKKYILYTIAITSIFFLIRCEKDENPDLLKTVFINKVPEIKTVVLSEITDSSAVTGGIINNDGGAKITSNGVCWSISPNPSINDTKTIDSIGKESFISKLTTLKPFTTYYVRAYAINPIGVAYGNALTFKTSTNLAKITTKDITDITDSSVICGGDISSDGGAEINARGVCWSTWQNPTINDSKTMDSIGIGSFISNPKGLAPNTTFYLKAYATNGVGTAYGEEKTFTTITSIPKLTTFSISSITYNSAISGGNIISTGGLPIIAKGVCWNTSPKPTIADNKTENGTGSTAFTSNITGLNPSTSYYVRAYATNNLGTAYSNEESFITLQPTLPVLTTNNATSITDTTAVSGGNIASDGGLNIIEKGVCWSTSQNPTIANNKTINGSGTGSFISNIVGLNSGTMNYVRAYATNSIGTSYGNQVIFTTSPKVGQFFQGGIVAYILKPFDIGFDLNIPHGLIASQSDQSSSVEWGCSGISIAGADGILIGTGNQNTIDILNGCSTISIAARICSNLILNGYSDWYLPSKDELYILYLNKIAIGGFADEMYWSSTEQNTIYSQNAYYQHFYYGNQDWSNKYNTHNVRAVRSF
jgi:hypothetical protein